MMIPDSVRSKLRRIPYARSFYWHLQIYYRKLSYTKQLRKGTPIIIFQGGKVGSASIKNSLESSGVEPVFHVHFMNPGNIKRIRQKYRARNLKSIDPGLSEMLWLGERLFYDIIKKDKRAKFIKLVREPISRSISNFFFSFTKLTGIEYDEAGLTVEQLMSIFIEKSNHSAPFRWFDEQLKTVLGIDVYKYPFPKEQGYLRIMEGNFELLILKTEVDDLVKEMVISEFLGVRDFKLIRSNVAQEKSYAAMYADFNEKLELPEDYVEIMCNSEYSRHFYTDAEIEATRLKWRNRVGETELPLAVYEELLRTSSRVLH